MVLRRVDRRTFKKMIFGASEKDPGSTGTAIRRDWGAQKEETSSVKGAILIFVTVALLAVFSADFGLRSVVILACSPQLPTQQNGFGGSAGQPPPNSINQTSVMPAPLHSQTYSWCEQAITEQKQLVEGMARLMRGLKITDIALVILTFFVGHRQSRISEGQREIMARQTAIQERQYLAAHRPRLIVGGVKKCPSAKTVSWSSSALSILAPLNAPPSPAVLKPKWCPKNAVHISYIPD